MSTADAVKILKRAESELRSLIERALKDDEYSEIAGIARLADGLSKLADSSGLARNHEVATLEPEPQSRLVTTPSESTPRPGSRLSQRRIRSLFPRFEREGDRLIKVSWSKKSREEYEHKAPREVVDLLIVHIKAKKGVGARFVADDIFPLRDIKRVEIPSYQAYLALAWLVHEGVVTKYGREGYLLKPTAVAKEQIAQLWENLPSRD